MKNIKKSLLVLALAFVMIFGLAGVAMATLTTDFTVTTTDGTYSETTTTLTITKAGEYTITTNGETTSDNIKISVTENASSADVILNFDGVNIKTTQSAAIEVTSTLGSLTINAIGSESSIEGASYGIDTCYSSAYGADLTIAGDANFNITATGGTASSITGIEMYSEKTLNFNNTATVTIAAGATTAGAGYSVGVGSTNCDAIININSGIVNVTSGAGANSHAISAQTLTIKEGATVEAKSEATSGNSYGIYANISVLIYGSLTAEGDSFGVWANGITVDGGTLTATGGDLGIHDKDNGSISYFKNGATIIATGGNSAISLNGSITLDSNLTILAYDGLDYTVPAELSGNSFVLSSGSTVKDIKITKTTSSTVSYTYYDIDLSTTGEGTIVPTGGDNATITTAKGGSRMFTFTPADGYEIDDVIVDGESVGAVETYYFASISADHTLEVVFANIDDTVAESEYYDDAVDWAIELGMLDADANVLNITTRGEAVYFIWMSSGAPESTIENPFNDISTDDYYYEAIVWAYEVGVTVGTTDTTFSPEMQCTRAHISAFIHRAEGEPIVDVENIFTDVAVGAYYYNAVLWAIDVEMIYGTTTTTFSPNQDCSVAEIVTFLYRYFA